MVSYDSLARALNEHEIANRVAIPHDEVRARYALSKNTVATFGEFTEVITSYYIYHYTTCVAPGAHLNRTDAASEAKSLLESQLRRGEGDINTYFVRARDGLDGGMRVVVDALAEGLKGRAVTNYVRHVFDQHVSPESFKDKVELIRQFIRSCGSQLASSIRADEIERYAHDWQALVNEYSHSLQRTSAMFRRL
jgi:hypothetical protein